MRVLAPLYIASLTAIGSVSAIPYIPSWFQSQIPLTGEPKKPLVNSEALQAAIKGSNLEARAVELAKIASLSQDEYNHPTRVIGSKGECILWYEI
jgi:aminopeptidase Y